MIYASKNLLNVYIDLNEATTVLQKVSECIKEFKNYFYTVKSEVGL